MTAPLTRFFLVLLVVFAPPAFSQETISYHGCTDARGRAVLSVADPASPVVAGTHVEAGRRVIRYNPALMPELSQTARLFFYAHECARHNLALPLDRPLSAEEAQRADCWGLDSLLRSGLLRSAADLAALQAELRFTPEQWALLPGLPREFDLPACQARIAAHPRLAAPPAGQDAWNACVRVCGDALFACRGAGCDDEYGRCIARCGER